MVTRCHELRLLMCYFVALCLAVDILWHFMCDGLSACCIRALVGFGGRGCCSLQLLLHIKVLPKFLTAQ